MSKRRDFIKKMAGLTTAILAPLPWTGGCTAMLETDRLGEVLPRRLLGKTGEKVSMLGLGGYHIGWIPEKDVQGTIEAALQGGIRFFDNAEGYGPDISETRYGKYLTPSYRDVIFLMTKTLATNAQKAREHLEASLKRMKTEYVDLWQVHAISSPGDVDDRLSNGVLDVLMEAKESGKARHIGFTGHQNPYAHLRMLERMKDNDILETIQMPINPVDAANEHSFIGEVLQEAVNRNYGILAMKTLAGGRFFPRKVQIDELIWETDKPVVPERMQIRDAMYFAWSLPISVLISGAENKDMINEKIEMAKTFSKLSEEQRMALVANVMDISLQGDVEYYKNVEN
jgi:aryl-alcohol dehydrogenase-like predicted oxidoreductase